MTTCVLSLGSNMGDRMAHLQSVVDGLGARIRAVSPVFETDAWGGVEQEAFLNAVVMVQDPDLDARGWLHRAQQLEQQNDRVREIHWGPRTLDVDLVCCWDGRTEIRSTEPTLTLPHPLAHQRAFVLIPWLALDPAAELTVEGRPRRVRELLDGLDAAERDGVRPTPWVLRAGTPEA